MPIGTPSVPYRLPGSQYERWVDIYTRLGVERILFLGQEVNVAVTTTIAITVAVAITWQFCNC